MPQVEKSSTQARESDSDWQNAAERARIITETASDAIITIDEHSKILFINQAAEHIFGYSVNELIGQQLTVLMPEYLRHLHQTSLHRYVETGTRHISWKAVELPGLHKNGTEISLELSFGEFSRNGARFFTGVARDVSRRKQDELRLVLQNSVTQILAESASLPEAATKVLEAICITLNWQVGEFWIRHPENDHLELIESWHLPKAEVSAFLEAGRASKFVPGTGIPGRIWSSKAPLWLENFPTDETFPRLNAAKSCGLIAAFGFPILRGNEIVAVIDFFDSKTAKPDQSLLEMMSDIGSQIGQFIERKKTQEELLRIVGREHEARLQAEALTRQLSALQRITDAALANLPLNDLLLELLKRIREVLNVDTAAVLLLEEEQNELLAWAALGLEEEVERGVRIPVGKGFAGKIIAERRPLIVPDTAQVALYNPLMLEKGIRSLLGVPLLVEGRSIGVVHVGTFQPATFTDEDISLLQLVADRMALAIEKARLVEIEREARTAAEKANALKDEFLTILSHELRTPLTPIMGWSHMMQAGLLGEPDIDQALAVITKNSHSLKHLIDDLLDMSAILSGKMRMEQRPVSLSSILRDAVENVKTEAQEAGIELIIPDLNEQAIIKGDQARLVQTFSNILHNAVKFTPEGGTVEVSTNISKADVVVKIRDSGVGIEQDFLPHVFERFRQADGSRTRMHGGLGLGLALVKNFVEAHGGEISVQSEGKNKGAVFSVRLPLEFIASSMTLEPSESTAIRDKSPARILIVEDQPDTLEMLAATFVAHGFEVRSCVSGAEAMKVAQEIDVDVLISDIAMPEIDGFELIRRLRRLPRLEDVPAVALTGYASDKDAAAALQAGFNIHLCKPIDPVELTALVEDLLRVNQQETT